MDDDLDTPWKEVVRHHFPEFMAFYFPAAHAAIDWSRPHAFLDQEFAALSRDAELGKRVLDKLVQVMTHDDGEQWVLVHLRFGALDAAVRARLAAADVDQLSAWAANVVDATTLDQVFHRSWPDLASLGRSVKCGPFVPLFIGSFPKCIVNNGTVRVRASHVEDAPLKPVP